MPRQHRHAVERGIYRDNIGYEVIARAGKATRSKRYPEDADREDMRRWRDDTAADLRSEHQPTEDSGTIRSGVTRYLKVLGKAADSPTKAALHAWAERHGDLQRRKLTAKLAGQAIDHWRAEGSGPQTLYYRVIQLQKLWRHLDGPSVRTPVDAITIKRPKGGKRPLWVPDETIEAVAARLKEREDLKQIPDSKTRARFLVEASTGQRPAQLRRAKKGDVDLKAGIWWVRPAKGGERVPVYLNSDMRAAWELFIAAKAWGHYDRRRFVDTLQHSGWPRDVRPYNVRHATGLTMSEVGGADLADIQSHFGHRSSATTRAFYVPQLHSRLKKLSESIDGRFSWGRVARQRGTNETGEKAS